MNPEDTKLFISKLLTNLSVTPEQAVMITMAIEFANNSQEFTKQFGTFGQEQLQDAVTNILNN